MNKLWEETPAAVISLFGKHHQPSLVYHDLSHTKDVVKHSMEISDHYRLPEDEKLALFIAAWFHDTGHLTGPVKGHEAVSVSIMKKFIVPYNTGEPFIDKIASCILATKMPSHPAGLSEEIICDADTYHLGTNSFFFSDEKIKRELQLREGKVIENWGAYTLKFLEQHRFYTAYCRDLLDQGKRSNIAIVRDRLSNKTNGQNL